MAELSAELRDRLAASNRIDPRSVPVRFSRLKKFALSAAHYLSSLNDDDDQDSLARRLGRGGHALLFGQPVVVWPRVRNGRAWESFAEAHSDKEILNSREYEQASRMVDALTSNELARALLLDGTQVEHRIDWTFMGRSCRSTIDSHRSEVVTELKSTRIMPPARFVPAATKMAYHAQLAYYSDALTSTGAGHPRQWFVVAVESVPPYSVTVFELTQRAIEMGRRQFRLWFEQLLVCETSDSWPGYSQTIVPFDVFDEEDIEGDDDLAGPDDPEDRDGDYPF